MKTVLVVDDEKNIRTALEGVLRDEGYAVESAASAEEALERLKDVSPDAVLLDIWLPGADGIEALKRMKSIRPALPVIMISGHANVDTAVRATKLGAYDFIEKPLSLDKVILTVEHAIEQCALVEENTGLRQTALERYEIIGRSSTIVSLRADIEKAAPSRGWVLITGENGTGKEFVARNIHLKSLRASKPFVEVNSAAIPEELIESELFGHEKGAFTSAVARKKGKFDVADKGTIFLDEIGDMSLKTQAKILRILQEQTFERVGGTELINVDVRVIAATNKDLPSLIKSGSFREDLYYRLNVLPFHVPPLRERATDIPLFVEHFIKESSRSSSRPSMAVSNEAMALLTAYSWPGNVRELRNVVERIVIMADSDVVTPDDLPSHIRGARPGSSGSLFAKTLLREARADFEREFIAKKLKEFDYNIPKTAEALGIERSHLYRKMKGYGIDCE